MITAIENIIDIILILLGFTGVLIMNSHPTIALCINIAIGAFFTISCVPHFYDMFKQKSVYTDYMVAYTFKYYPKKQEYFTRNIIVYALYYYIFSFNLDYFYCFGLTLLLSFDIIVSYGLLNKSLLPYLISRAEEINNKADKEKKDPN